MEIKKSAVCRTAPHKIEGTFLEPFRFNLAPLRRQFFSGVNREGCIAIQIVFRVTFKVAEVIDPEIDIRLGNRLNRPTCLFQHHAFELKVIWYSSHSFPNRLIAPPW